MKLHSFSKVWREFIFSLLLLAFVGFLPSSVFGGSTIDKFLAQDNQGKEGLVEAPTLDDLGFLRKVTIDLIGRIPSRKELDRYLKWPVTERRQSLVESLLEHERFSDRWTAFYADMLRIRTASTGGGALLAYVHKSIGDGKPFDELTRELISAQGRSDSIPALGFILNDNVDPMALTAATAQVFLGVRMQCAQCHDHPFDDWEQRQFYEMATFFGKTRRVESRLTRAIYTTEGKENAVLWPPERKKSPSRAPIDAKFPFLLEKFDDKPSHVSRLEAKRAAERLKLPSDEVVSLESLLDSTEATIEVSSRKKGPAGFDPDEDLKGQNAALDIKGDLYKASQMRAELAKLVTHPRNRYFAQNFVNRLWAELMGRGIYEPIDDYSEYQTINQPKTLDFLRKEFVALGYDLKDMIRLVVTSDAYGRGRLEAGHSAKIRIDSEMAFVAGSPRRMIGEALFDSIAVAGNLEDFKWPSGANLKTVRKRQRVYLDEEGKPKASPPAASLPVAGNPAMVPMASTASAGGYDLEKTIALDFNALLARDDVKEELEAMRMRSEQELEAMRMAAMQSQPTRRGKYKYVYVEEEVDDNPRYSSSYRMASPAAPDHFLRIFGQPGRDRLGDFRDFSASMRQALMMLNGKITHEAARVGSFERLHSLLVGKKKDFPAAIRRVYLGLFTREPTKEETKEGLAIIRDSESALEGMADLRWAMLNSHEFKFLP